jgi:DNA-binding transcriptional MocR family regulator
MPSKKSDLLLRDLLQQIASGDLQAGARLPTHRELAKAKRISLTVVNRAYGELARRGLTIAAGKRGTIVAAAPKRASLGSPDVAAKEIADLSHNYIAFGELNTAIKTLFLSSALHHWDQSGLGASDSIVTQVGQRWFSTLSINNARLAIFATSGGQHGLLACLLAFVGRGEQVAVEQFTYTGMKLAASVLGINLVPINSDSHGMSPAALDRAAKDSTLKAIYLMPSFHNPLATTIPEERRKDIAEVCKRNGLIVIEDDPHRSLTAKPIPSFLELLPTQSVHVTTMSKILGPGMRLGFVATAPSNALRLQSAIRAANWTIPAIETQVVASALDTMFPELLMKLRDESDRRQTAAREIFGSNDVIASPNAPHLCLSLGNNWTSAQFTSVALDNGVKIIPGTAFATGKGTKADLDFVRISLMSEAEEWRLLGGLRRLKELVNMSPAAFLNAP